MEANTYHFLITRYNLISSSWNTDKRNNRVTDKDWLLSRENLFLRYCLPSVINQKDKNFYWFIYFQEGTESDLVKVLDEISKYKFIHPFFIAEIVSLNNHVQKSISNIINKKAKVITSRLDNDDAIHYNFIKNIKKELINEGHNTVLSFSKGLCLNLTEGFTLSTLDFTLNQFVSLLEFEGQGFFKGVYCNPHNKWGPRFIVKDSKIRNMWLQIVHKRNLLNEFRGRLSYPFIIKSFGKIDVPNPWIYNLKVFKSRIKAKVNKFPAYYRLKKLINGK